MSMTIASSVIDASMAITGAVGIVIAFVAALRGAEASIMTDARGSAAEPGIAVKRAA